MKVFVAGGSGAVGRRLVPRLIAAGHEVVATTRDPRKEEELRLLGAEPALVDALDEQAAVDAVGRSEPEVVVHELTALPRVTNLRRWDRDFALTNRLRTEGTDHLIRAAQLAGARRLVAQSFTGWPNIRAGGPLKNEDDPLDPGPPAALRESLEAIRYLERAVLEAPRLEGIVLRYGSLYGPGTAMTNEYAEMIRRRKLPMIGDGAGIWSFIHVDDAAAATVAAIERGAPGIYNIVDDDPAPVSEWLPRVAELLAARPPRRIPVWLGRLATGEVGVSMMTRIRGSSNAKVKRELGWRPRHRSWRDGFRVEEPEGRGDVSATARRHAGDPNGGGVSAQRIDVHHHYVTDDLVDELGRVGIHHVGGQPLAASRFEHSLAVMDRHEIDAALLSVPIPLTFEDVSTSRRVARSLNEAGARGVADHRGRFGLLATLPLPDIEGGLAEIDHALDTLGADGIVLLSNYRGVYLGDMRLEPIFFELDRRACVVLVHPTVFIGERLPTEPSAGSPVPTLEPSLFEFLFDTTRAVANLIIGGTLERHPSIRLILAHAGGTIPYVHDRVVDRGPILERARRTPPPTPDELQQLLADGLAASRRQLEGLFYDLTLSANDTVLDCVDELVPSAQLLLGTDFPLAQEIGVRSTLAGLAGHDGFDAADRRAIEGDNARRLFPRLAGPKGPQARPSAARPGNANRDAATEAGSLDR